MQSHSLKLAKISISLIALMVLTFGALMAPNRTAIPQLVDQARVVIGPEPVAFAEDTFYAMTDAYNRWTFRGHTTSGYWTATDAVPPVGVNSVAPPGAAQLATPKITQPPASLTALEGSRQTRSIPRTATRGLSPTPSACPDKLKTAPLPSPAVFPPRELAPLYPALAAPGEGVWIPIPNSFDAAAALMYKTFLHPDPERPYALVAMVAIDATRVRLHAVAGTVEPVSAVRVQRSGLIRSSDLPSLVAAFNGGFKAMHGHYGMMVDGQAILPSQPGSDTIAIYHDGGVRIAPWEAISDTLVLMQSFRQTPPYLAYRGQVNSALQDEQLIAWGASVSRNTVIWRSALGLSADGQTLYYAAGESLTARRLAEALVAAGASDVAELDVNWTFERFLIYAPPTGNFNEQSLLSQMVYQPGMYVDHPAARDFFYLTLVPSVPAHAN